MSSMTHQNKYDNFSAEDILRYNKGEMNDLEQNTMERAALDDPFLADALEGWSTELDASLLNKESDSKHTVESKAGMNSILKNVLVGLGAGVLIFSFLKINQGLSELNELEQKVKAQLERPQMPYIVSPQQDSLDEMEIDLAQVISVQDQIDVQRVVVEMIPEAITSVETQVVEKSVQKDTPPAVLQSKVEQELTAETSDKSPLEPKHEIYFLHDLKVADYKKLRTEEESSIAIWSVLSGHTPANQELKNEASGEQGFTVEKIPYVDYLDDAMSAFAEGNYKDALKRYRLILKNYPDDVNALFYGGLSYYNLGRQKKAASYLNSAQHHSMAVFNQEAEYYRALSLIQAGKVAEAQFVLKRIIEKKSFYTKQAKALVEGF